VFEIVELDRDYRVVTRIFLKEFASEEEAKAYCAKETWTGFQYFCKPTTKERKA
jgi:hypothetical protein